MKVELITPQGYCAGVIRAIDVAIKAKMDNKDKNVYVLGMLVHNQHVISHLNDKGIITLLGKEEDEINNLKPNDVLIFTAHGHDEKLEELARNKGIIIYDATCSRVKANIDIVKKEINEGHQVIYIGQNGHKETMAALSISNKVSLYDTKLLINYQFITDKSPLVINQTTLNFYDLKCIHDDIKAHIPGARIIDEICPATRLRQEALAKIPSDTDVIFIVGDKKSSNTNKLFDIAKKLYTDKDVYMVSSLNDVLNINLNGKEKASISSGASTPKFIVDEIYNYLISK